MVERYSMGSMSVRDRLFRAIGSIDVFEDLPLSGMTTFRIGGPADFVISPENVEELSQAIQVLRDCEIPYIVLGRGSNILASDEGFRGAVIRLSTNYFQRIQVEDDHITAEAGVTLVSAEGAYTHNEKSLVICVVNKHQIADVQRLIQRYPGSFAYITSVNSTVGNFKRIK